MSKVPRLLAATTFALFLCALPAAAQTQYLADNTLDANPGVSWTYGDPTNGHVWTTDRCAASGSTYAARLDPGEGIAQQISVTSSHVSYSIRLDAYFSDSGGTSADAINVYIRNLNTQVEENHSFTAAQYGHCASTVAFTTTYDYDNVPVLITVKRSNGSTSPMDIEVDNIYFFGRPF
jgi:hypothetical protein